MLRMGTLSIRIHPLARPRLLQREQPSRTKEGLMRTAHIVMAALVGITTMHAQEGKPYVKKEGAETAKADSALTTAMKEAKISLVEGLLASEKAGQPISAKFEVEEGKLQLSIYTMRGDQFFEVIVDHKNGKIVKTEPITGGDDLKAAKSQAEAMAKAKGSLRQLVRNAERKNPGYRAMSATPEIENDQTHADLLLCKGGESKQVEEGF